MKLKTFISKIFYKYIPHNPKFINGINLLKKNQFGLAGQELSEGFYRYKEKKYLAYLLSVSASFHNVAAGRDEMLSLCEEASRDFHSDRTFWNFYGRCWLDVAEKHFLADEADKCFINAIEIGEGKFADDWYGLGMVRQYQQRYNEAADCYLKSIKCDPTFFESQFRIWSLYKDELINDNFGIEPLKKPGEYLMDFDFNDVDKISRGEVIKARKIKEFGAIIFRNVIKKDKFLSSLKKEILTYTAKYNYNKSFIAPYDLAPSELKKKIQKIIDDKIFNKLLPLISEWNDIGWEPFRNPSWWLQYMPVLDSESQLLTGNRSESPVGEILDRPYGYATPLHQDNPVNCQFSDWQTFWIPLDKCGPGIAPSMKVLTVPIRSAIDPLEQKLGRINSVRSKLISIFFDNAMFTINANPGDVIIFGRYMLHQTYYDLNMKSARNSIDLRWVTGPSIPRGMLYH
jgi:tetratricopeptide (TPR) repeat protein